ncbi:BQ5605_C043g12103 [Microbotryum silenes-dioicae]|uniref:BQ5605_C043g12103 protein n=1 Tax=Microbotryum silenes-dioicae TaxID=796604 RepID=A0A2X0MQU4_9BASI|nr:BQ5605_C043g12103 [Microbotryum silenes-dioicae]
MTTMQPILALRHVYEPAVQLCRTDSVVSAMANSTLGSPHHHLRKGECAGLESRSNPSSPTFRSATTSARRRPCAPTARLGTGSAKGPSRPDTSARAARRARCGYLPLPSPISSIGNFLKARIANARSYNNALSFTSLAAHWDQTQVGTLGPPVFRTWLIDPAEATNTRLQGPDSADSHMQRSTLTKLESMLRTGNRFTDAPTTFLRRARKWRCLSAIPTPTREIVDVKTLFSRCTVIDVPRVGPSTKSLARSIHGFHPNIPLCGSIELGHSSPKDRNKEGEDEEEGDKKNGDGEHKHLWLLLGCSHSVKARAQTDIECLNTYDEGQVKGVKVVSLAFTNPLRSTCTNATSPHGTRRPFPAFVIERYSQAEADRLNYIQLH